MFLVISFGIYYIYNKSKDIAPENGSAISGYILSEGAEAVEVKDLGKKRLAYEIEDFSDAYYYVVELTSETDASTKEFDRLAKISDDIIRHMVVRLEK